LLRALQHKLLYYPARDMLAGPADFGFEYETVQVRTDDGVTLHGWWLPAPQARVTVLFFHGNAGNVSYWLEATLGYRELGWNVLLVDYRGYGLSEGSPSEEGTYRDARAAWNHLTAQRRIEASSIVVIGRSLGGAVAMGLMETARPGALVLEATFTSVPDMVAQLLPIPGARSLSSVQYPSLQRLRRCHTPVLVAHSPDDEVVPYSHGRALFEAANPPKRFVELRAGHNEAFYVCRDAYLTALQSFVCEHLTARSPTIRNVT